PSDASGVGGFGAGFPGGFDSSGPLVGAAALWFPSSDPFSSQLDGPRTLMNDVSIYSTISKLTNSSMRSFMSAPNGDFIAWFPDYFGQFGTAGRMIVRDIELVNEGFNMTWNDENMVTHQFVA